VTEWLQEGYREPEPEPEVIPEHEAREYGTAVPFERAFSLTALARIVERLIPARLPVVAAFGLVLIFTMNMRFGVFVPITGALDDVISSSAAGLALRQVVLKVHLGTFLTAYASAIICAQVAGWARGDAEDDLEAFMNWELGLRGVAYEAIATAAQLAVAAPFFGGALGAAYLGWTGAASNLSWLAVIASTVLWMATRPGLWAVAIDDLPLRFAFLQSLVLPLRYPHILGALFGVSFAALVISLVFLAVPAILALGVIQCSVAVAWVLFGSTADEIDGSDLLRKLVKVDRPEPL